MQRKQDDESSLHRRFRAQTIMAYSIHPSSEYIQRRRRLSSCCRSDSQSNISKIIAAARREPSREATEDPKLMTARNRASLQPFALAA
jgi:hypothetical protein